MGDYGPTELLLNMDFSTALYSADSLDDIFDAVYEEIALKVNTSILSVVATTNDYNDLDNLPSIFSGAYSDLTGKPTIPTKTSDLTNDSGFLTSAPVTSVAGKTGAVSLVKADVSLGNVDNTSDANKPVSTATQTALNGKFNTPSGSTSQYLRGDGMLATLPSTKRQETYLGNTDGSGNYTVTYGTAFAATPDVQPQIQAGSTTDTRTVRITASSTTGFTVNVRNRSEVLGLLPSYSNVPSIPVGVLVTER